VHLNGAKAGVWADFACTQRGDALDLVCAVLSLNKADAIDWAKRWLGLAGGEATLPRRPRSATPSDRRTAADPDHWRKPWYSAKPIAGSPVEVYLRQRGLSFVDPYGEVLRFAARRARLSPVTGKIEHHPALLAILRDIRSGEPCGIINVFLRSDSRDRLRDPKGKISTGRFLGAAVMLTAFEDVTCGLTVAEGIETGLALLADDQAPVWCVGGAGNLSTLPVLDEIEALTIAADNDEPGRRAADTAAARWCAASREVLIVTPQRHGDWADPRKVTS
jgi:hypothetical protein